MILTGEKLARGNQVNYTEIMQKALKGRAVNAAAKEMGLPQASLDRWVKGKNIPDYSSAAIIAAEARVSLGEMMAVLVKEDQRRKGLKEIIATGFLLLTNAVNRLSTRMLA